MYYFYLNASIWFWFRYNVLLRWKRLTWTNNSNIEFRWSCATTHLPVSVRCSACFWRRWWTSSRYTERIFRTGSSFCSRSCWRKWGPIFWAPFRPKSSGPSTSPGLKPAQLELRPGRYDDIYRMGEIKYRFILCSIVYFVVSQNT